MSASSYSNNSNSGGGQQEGIDIRLALEILSERSVCADQHSHSADETCSNTCTTRDADETKPMSMGQIIDLQLPVNNNDDEQQQQQHHDTTREKQSEKNQLTSNHSNYEQLLHAAMQPLSRQDLLRSVLKAQEQRVQAYQDFDRALETMLRTRDVTNYPSVCAEATAVFCVVSETIKALTETYNASSKKSKQQPCIIAALQKHEQNKLQLTAALHLEKIRLQQEANNEPIAALLRAGVVALEEQLRACVECIRDAVDDIQCAIVDQDDE
jgi:hypothetical protein